MDTILGRYRAHFGDQVGANADWSSQIQFADNFHDAMTSHYQNGESVKAYLRPDEIKGALFYELAYELYRRSRIKDNEILPITDEDIERCREYLSEGGHKAVDIVLEDRKRLRRYLGHKDILKTKVHGPNVHASTEVPHVDAAHVAILRYAGPKTRQFHGDDVMGTPKQRGTTLKENARFIDIEHGNVWVQQGSGIFPFKFMKSFPFVQSNHGSVHCKGQPNGQIGLMTYAEFVR